MNGKSWIHGACVRYDETWRPEGLGEVRATLAAEPRLAAADLYAAAAAGAADAARALLAADPAALDRRGGPFGWPPLLYACYSRLDGVLPGGSTLAVARLLLEAGADPNAGFLCEGELPPFTALTGAFGGGEGDTNQPPHPASAELAFALLAAGADPNDGQTLYNRHARPGDDHLELLLAHGLGRDQGGPWYARYGEKLESPARLLTEELWSAARRNFPARVEKLLAAGADPDLPGRRDGRTPAEAAARHGHTAIVERLVAAGARRPTPSSLEAFAAACIAGDRDQARTRLDTDPTLMEQLGAHGRIELLHRAVECRRPAALRLMAELGFEISGHTRHDGVGMSLAATPLHNAAWLGDLELIRTLLDLGADPDRRDPNYHATPLGWALYNHQQEAADLLAPQTRPE